jgi:hypothetical protein
MPAPPNTHPLLEPALLPADVLLVEPDLIRAKAVGGMLELTGVAVDRAATLADLRFGLEHFPAPRTIVVGMSAEEGLLLEVMAAVQDAAGWRDVPVLHVCLPASEPRAVIPGVALIHLRDLAAWVSRLLGRHHAPGAAEMVAGRTAVLVREAQSRA